MQCTPPSARGKKPVLEYAGTASNYLKYTAQRPLYTIATDAVESADNCFAGFVKTTFPGAVTDPPFGAIHVHFSTGRTARLWPTRSTRRLTTAVPPPLNQCLHQVYVPPHAFLRVYRRTTNEAHTRCS